MKGMHVGVSVDRAYVRSSTRHYSSEALQAGAFRSRGRVIQRLGDALCVRPQQPLVCQITSKIQMVVVAAVPDLEATHDSRSRMLLRTNVIE